MVERYIPKIGIAAYKGSNSAPGILLDGLLDGRGESPWGIASINVDRIDSLSGEGIVKGSILSRSSGICIGSVFEQEGIFLEAPMLSADHLVAVAFRGNIPDALADQIASSVGESSKFSDSVIVSCSSIKSPFSLVVVHRDFDEIVVIQNGFPLFVGSRIDDFGKEFFVSSDRSKIEHHSSSINELDKGDVARIGASISISRLISKNSTKNNASR